MIKFFLIANRVGQLRVSRYFEKIDSLKRQHLESTIISHCLKRIDKQCTIFQLEDTVIIYRKYVNLYLIVGTTPDENELAVLELMHNFLETLDLYFKKVSELDIMFNLDRVYMILDEMLINGIVAQTTKDRILVPIQMFDSLE
ncbi:AP-4 complex subunit sigma-1-like [Pomacea canaliculata]|uniref:AP-4 complex subunit sigma-1-like n=1 Tax=Pomacea canaliculata TaxID=400727 RepID=UPI000D733A8A|nr:AP-4 complex subunit sigma-1-like [Pomacea canaliculata]